MIVANFTSIKPEMAHSRTYEDFSKLIGERPERLGIVSRMKPYEKMTASYLTEGMGNVMKNGEKSGSKYQKINSLMFEWEIEQNHVEYISFACDVTCDGENGMEIPMAFTRRYYELDETFLIEGSKQMCIVIDGPTRKADDFWEYTVRLMDADYSARLDLDSCKAGMLTRWIGNVKQEYHDNGFTKYQSNAEKQRGYINEIRVDIDASSRYEMMEDTFIKLAKGDERNGWKSAIFKLPAMKKVLLDNFMMARNQSLLWQHTTMDANGKSVIADRQGRPIIAGDGIIPQINRFASKFNYARMTPSLLNEVIMTLAQKCDNMIGNNFAFVCNARMWFTLQTTMSEFLANHHHDANYIYSKTSPNGYIKAGATYKAYEFGGNTITLQIDDALTLEYPNQEYGIMVDLTADKASGRPAIEMFTIEGKQFIENTLTGVGIQSGAVATPVAGIKHVISGWQGVAVYNPYRSVVLYQNA